MNGLCTVPAKQTSPENAAEIGATFMRRANRLGGGYFPIPKGSGENPEEGEIDQKPEGTKKDSAILLGDNLPTVNLSKYDTNGKEANPFRLRANNKGTKEIIKKAEIEFLMDLKTFVSKTAIDLKFTRVRSSTRREDRETASGGYQPVFENLLRLLQRKLRTARHPRFN